MFVLESKSNERMQNDVFMFNDMSLSAQKKALEHAKIQHPKERHWDILPVAYRYDYSNKSQDEIDTECLHQLGYYRLVL